MKRFKKDHRQVVPFIFILLVTAMPLIWASSAGGSSIQSYAGDGMEAPVESRRLKTLIGISDDLSDQMNAIIRTHHHERAVLNAKYNRQIEQLKQIIQDEDNEKLQPHISAINKTIRQLQELSAKKWNSLKKLLSVRQQARYLIYQDTLQKALRQRALEGMKNSTQDLSGS